MASKTREEYIKDILVRHAEEQKQTDRAIKDVNALPDALLALPYKFTIHNAGHAIACFSATTPEKALAVLDGIGPLDLCLLRDLDTHFKPQMMVESLRKEWVVRNVELKDILLNDGILCDFSAGVSYGQTTKLMCWLLNNDGEPFEVHVDVNPPPAKLHWTSDQIYGHPKKCPKYTWSIVYAPVIREDGTACDYTYRDRWPNLIRFREGSSGDSGTHIMYGGEKIADQICVEGRIISKGKKEVAS